MRGDSVFTSAITGDDGEVDAGYLALYIVTLIVLGAIPVMCIGSLAVLWLSTDHHFDVQGLGVGIGAVCGGFGVTVGAVGAFRMGDKDRNNNRPAAPAGGVQ